MYGEVAKIFIPTAFAFFLGIFITPIATHFFYKYKMWKKKVRTLDVNSESFKNIHKDKEVHEVSTPCIGGIIIFVSVITTIFFFAMLAEFFPTLEKLNFLSRSQTFIPLGIFILGALLGLIDDILEITGKSNITRSAKWYTNTKILMVIFFGILAGGWFFLKLDMHQISIPFDGLWELGFLFIPLVVFVMLATFSSGVIDGVDGLSGGVLAIIFAAYSLIAYTNNQIDVAVFCGVITGATLAFLWFNIPPARFYMGEVGMMPLTIVLATIAFITDTVLLLPIIALPLTITAFSSFSQILSKKYLNKKIFIVAPIHHHFEALGWPSYKVTMRYWIFGIMFAIIGVILSVIS